MTKKKESKKKAPTNKAATKATKAAAPEGTKGTRAAKTKAKQQRIPGTEPNVPKDLLELADDYREKRDSRMEMQEREKTAHDHLRAKMSALGIERFSLDEDTEVFHEMKDKVRVRRKKSEKEDEAAA